MTNHRFKSGVDRRQASFLPPRVEDYVARDNLVRAIELFVESLNLVVLGFRYAGSYHGAGQPSYHPGDMLKLYLYGYMHRVRSTRRLAREAKINLEVIWLLRGLEPGYRTIGDFRKDNWKALKAVNREFVLMMRALKLAGGKVVAIDGAFFDGNASKASITPHDRLAKRVAAREAEVAAIEAEIEAYKADLEANDAAEEKEPSDHWRDRPTGDDLAEKVAAAMEKRAKEKAELEQLEKKAAEAAEKRAKAKAELEQLEKSGETQLSRTDSDARLLSKRGQVVAGYNVQIAVDDKHKLIVASEVVNDGNDTGQLHKMANAAKDALGVETLTALADTGYYNSNALKECEEDGIVAYVPPPDRTGRLKKKGRITHEEFVYDAEADAYRCPNDKLLKPTETPKINTGGRVEIRYVSRKADCDGCPLRARCVTEKTPTRTIQRWEHEDVLDRHRARMKEADAPMRRRAELAEHPFGTLKCRAGYRHFLVRGLDKVRGEWSLMALGYNFTRVLEIIGFDGFMAFLAKWAEDLLFLGRWNGYYTAVTRVLLALLALFGAAAGQNDAGGRLTASIAA
jgi:transposase